MNSEISQGGVQREAIRHAGTLAKKNKHLFLKDYSGYSKDQYIFDNFSHLQSFKVLVEKKGLLSKFKTSAEEKRVQLLKRL